VTPILDAERLAVLVHEVRSPVAALSAIAEALDGDTDVDTRREFVRLVTLACRGIERVVADVAVASIRFERFDPVGVVEDVVAAARFRGAAVDLSLPADMPIVRGDPSRIRQALDNLITNALVHGTSGEPVSVSVTADTVVRIAVSDTGGGIDPDDLERIFEPRVRLEPATSTGTGLGLALARAIAEGHGGSLTATSTVGAGTTFTLSLPVAEP